MDKDIEQMQIDLLDWAKVIRDIITRRQREDIMLRNMYSRMNEIYKGLV